MNDRRPSDDVSASAEALDPEYARIRSAATYTYLLGYTIPLAVTSALALRRGEPVLGYTLAVFAVFAALILWDVYRHGLRQQVRVILVAAAFALFLYLVLSGGYAGTGLFWCFSIFVVIYHFSSAVVGLAVNLTLMLLAGLLLLLPQFSAFHPDYATATISRFLIAGSITCILIFVYAMVQQVLTERLQETQQRLFRASMTDELTGLINRRSMQQTLRQEDQRDQRRKTLAIAVADVDHFKRINDSLGHDAGDHILRHIADVMREALRASDRVARWGGEEFLLLMEVFDLDEAVAVVERVRASLERDGATYNGERVNVTASFGVKVITEGGPRLQDAIVEADKNLLRAKETGRNRVIAS